MLSWGQVPWWAAVAFAMMLVGAIGTNAAPAGSGIGTKAQQALKLQQEENKLERKVKSKEQKLAEAERQFELRQQKKKEKHRGR